MDVRLPDGTVVNGVPDGMSQADLVAKLKANGHDTSWYQAPQTQATPEQPARNAMQEQVNTMPPFLRAATGLGEAALQAGSGAAGAITGGLAGLGALATGQSMPGDTTRNIQSAMTYQPRTTQGQTASRLVNLPFELYGKVLHGVGNTVRGPPSETGQGGARDLAATTLDVFGDVAPTLYGAGRVATAPKPAVKPLTQQEQTLKAGQQEGMVVAPAEMGGSSLLEGIGGKIKTQQVASQRNQSVVNKLSAEYLGLPPDTQITTPVLEGIRKNAGQAYEAVKTQGGHITPDLPYLQDLLDLSKTADRIKIDFPNAKLTAQEDIGKLANGAYTKGGFTAEGAIEYVKQLRSDARSNLRAADDPNKLALGTAQKSTADAIESLVERNLAATGKADLMQAYKDARTQIAKTYTIEDALNPSTANVSARKLAKAPYATGGVKTAANFAQAFPKSTQVVENIGGVPSVSPLDLYGSVGASALGTLAAGPGGGLLASGIPLVRQLAVPAALSKHNQRGLLSRQTPPPSILPLTPGILQSQQQGY